MPEGVEHQFAQSIAPADCWREVPGVPRATQERQDVPPDGEDGGGYEEHETEPDEHHSVRYRPCPDGCASQSN